MTNKKIFIKYITGAFVMISISEFLLKRILGGYRFLVVILILNLLLYFILKNKLNLIKKDIRVSDKFRKEIIKKQHKLIGNNDVLETKIEQNTKINKQFFEEYSYLENILNNMNELIVITNQSNNIIFSNKVFKKYTQNYSNQMESNSLNFDVKKHINYQNKLLNTKINQVEFIKDNFSYLKKLVKSKNSNYVLTIGKDISTINYINEKLIKTISKSKDTEKEAKILNEKFMALLEFINKVKDFEKLTVNQILKQSFRYIFKLVDKSDYGSVYKFSEEGIIFLDAIGHDLKKLQNIDIPRDEFENHNTVKPTIIKEILKTVQKNHLKEIIKASKEISETLNFSINSKDKLIASISLDIKKDSNKEFNQNDIKIVESISRLLNIIISLMVDKRKENNFVNRILFSFINLIKIHNENLYKHSMNVGKLSKKFAKHLKLTQDLIDEAYYSGILHDIGYILQDGNNIKEYLDDDESHIYDAYKVLKNIENLEGIAKIVYYHHEKYDGSGYPEGIQGSQIPVVSQILALVNFYEQEKNILKKDNKEIKRLLNKQRDVAFDSSLVDEFLKMVKL